MRFSISAQSARKRDFIILAQPRAGSHMLASAINSHPDVCCLGQYRMEFLDSDLDTTKLVGEVVYGTRELYHDIEFDRVILLTRNAYELKESRTAANKTGLLNQRLNGAVLSGNSGLTTELFEIEREWATFDEFTRKCERPVLRTTYEALCSDKHIDTLELYESDRISDFLGITRHELLPQFKKVRSSPTLNSDIVGNGGRLIWVS